MNYLFRPSLETYGKLIEFSQQNGSFDGGDQGLLNSYFSDWSTANINRILPFGYNVHAAATYTYAPAYKQFANDVRVIHFLGSSKPWTSQQPPSSGGFNSFWNVWWKFYTNNYSPQGKLFKSSILGSKELGTIKCCKIFFRKFRSKFHSINMQH